MYQQPPGGGYGGQPPYGTGQPPYGGAGRGGPPPTGQPPYGGAPPPSTGQPAYGGAPYGGGAPYYGGAQPPTAGGYGQPATSYTPSGYGGGGYPPAGGGAPPSGYPTGAGSYGGAPTGGYGGSPTGGYPTGGPSGGYGGYGGAPTGGYPTGGAPMGGPPSYGGYPTGGAPPMGGASPYGGAPSYQGGYPSGPVTGYPATQTRSQTVVQTTTVTTSKLAFFNHVNSYAQRDYILIVDKSGSMSGSRWREAEKAVSVLAPNICRCDPDGITLYFFSSPGSYPKYANLRDAGAVAAAFRSQYPGGSTCLHGVLNIAFAEHFRKGGSPTTILVITDGEPDNKRAVEDEIRRAANQIRQDSELSVSFIQIGNDHGAKKWLQKLDDDLRGCRFDIVDAITADEMAGMAFDDFIAKSIND